MNLKEALVALKSAQKKAAVEVETLPYKSRAALEMARNAAIVDLPRLKVEYGKLARKNSLGIFTDKEFETDLPVVRADRLYRLVAERIYQTMGASKEFGPTQLAVLHEVLKEQNRTMGIRTMKMPGISSIRVVKNVDDMVAYVKQLVQSVVDDELIRIDLDQKITEAAIASDFSGEKLAVIVTGADTSERAAVASLFTTAVSVEDEEELAEAVEGLKSAVKTKSQSNNKTNKKLRGNENGIR